MKKTGRSSQTLRLTSGLVLTVGVLAILMSGCTADNVDGETDTKIQYIRVLCDHFSAMAEAGTGLDEQFSQFNDGSLDDANWVSTTKGYLNALQAECDAITQYNQTPEEYTDIQAELVGLATQGKEAIAMYNTGIDNKDYTSLQQANSALDTMSDNLTIYASTIEDKLLCIDQ